MRRKNVSPTMFVTDFDGTLFRSDRTISEKDLNTLKELGEAGITRVIATGRSLFSFMRAIETRLPVDYLIFSTGAGIAEFDQAENKIIKSWSLMPGEAGRVGSVFEELNLDYMVHDPVPENHLFKYRRFSKNNRDFQRRLDFYKGCHSELPKEGISGRSACQFLAILPDHRGGALLEEIRRRLPGLNVIRATSPLDGTSVWVEVFSSSVSKSQAVAWLAERLGISQENTVAVGNDYNDEDLLEWAKNSYVVSNAPEDLKGRYVNVPSNDNHGVTFACRNFLDLVARDGRSLAAN